MGTFVFALVAMCIGAAVYIKFKITNGHFSRQPQQSLGIDSVMDYVLLRCVTLH